jgi:hypothetical protein
LRAPVRSGSTWSWTTAGGFASGAPSFFFPLSFSRHLVLPSPSSIFLSFPAGAPSPLRLLPSLAAAVPSPACLASPGHEVSPPPPWPLSDAQLVSWLLRCKMPAKTARKCVRNGVCVCDPPPSRTNHSAAAAHSGRGGGVWATVPKLDGPCPQRAAIAKRPSRSKQRTVIQPPATASRKAACHDFAILYYHTYTNRRPPVEAHLNPPSSCPAAPHQCLSDHVVFASQEDTRAYVCFHLIPSLPPPTAFTHAKVQAYLCDGARGRRIA